MKTLNDLEYDILKIKGAILKETRISRINTLKNDLATAQRVKAATLIKLEEDPLGTYREMRKTILSKMNNYAAQGLEVPGSLKAQMTEITKEMHKLQAYF